MVSTGVPNWSARLHTTALLRAAASVDKVLPKTGDDFLAFFCGCSPK